MPVLTDRPIVKFFAGTFLERWLSSGVSTLQMRMLGAHKDRRVLDVIRSIWREHRGNPLPNEAYMLHSLAAAQQRLPGDFAEVGVFRGSSARMICEGKGEKRLWLFDTFEGLPDRLNGDDGFRRGQYACSLESVTKYLSQFPDVHFVKGIFPDSVQNRTDIQERKFSLVSIDVDLPEGTRACLDFFYPRLVPGGVLVSHDYSFLAGVKRAFDEFLADKPERVIELPTSQCLLIKLPPSGA
jgi:O-methyltransferase